MINLGFMEGKNKIDVLVIVFEYNVEEYLSVYIDYDVF